MGLQKLIIILVFLAVLGGSFAAVYYMPDITRKTDPEKTTVPLVSQEPSIFTVTGTIIRIDTLIMLGRGTRHDVPVLANVEMSK